DRRSWPDAIRRRRDVGRRGALRSRQRPRRLHCEYRLLPELVPRPRLSRDRSPEWHRHHRDTPRRRRSATAPGRLKLEQWLFLVAVLTTSVVAGPLRAAPRPGGGVRLVPRLGLFYSAHPPRAHGGRPR